MDNLLQLAMDMILCLLIAGILGGIIGYLLGKMKKCDDYRGRGVTTQLNSYEDESAVPKIVGTTTASAAAASATTTLTPREREGLSLSGDEDPADIAKMQAFHKSFDTIEGERPPVLSAPRNGFADDLKEISGIGLKIEEALNELGIYHFSQIAEWTPENVQWIDNYLVFKGRVNRENWIGQAKLLAAGQATHFSKKVQRGEKKY
ncbi:MAG: hypothetical protein DSZ05_04295 [Sulfurospirillum sp.]|nr:MAG: hypothetical protein DSZ05_04295 [Sulfurospirillum sp.]